MSLRFIGLKFRFTFFGLEFFWLGVSLKHKSTIVKKYIEIQY